MKHIIAILTIFSLFVSCQSTPAKPVVAIVTNIGTIEVTLDNQRAPVTVKNFLSYVRDGFYNDTLFHRVISGFMIQGGGFGSDLQQKETRSPIPNESGNGLLNKRGTIAMARQRALDSATSQFFINLVDNTHLDKSKYAVFGEVTKGMDVVDKIAGLPTQNLGGAFANIPVQRVIIERIEIR